MPPKRKLWSSVVGCITLEPMVFLFYLSNAISAFGANNLILQKSCHPDLDVEPDYSVPCPDEASAQKVLTEINTWKPILESLIPLVFVIFLGTWSDTHGKRRKPLVFIPLIGELVKTVSIMGCVYYWKVSPSATAAVEGLIRGISGGAICFSFGSNTYVSDITTVEERTVRIGVISAIAFIGSPIGIILGGILRLKVGFFYLFAACAIISIVALILGVLLMKDTACEESKLKTFEGVCDSSHFIQSMKTVFKKRPENKRKILFLMGGVPPLFLACFIGEFSVMYFFFRYKFHMGEVEFGNYCAFKMITIFFGTFISLIICSKILKMTDAAIGWLGTVTQIAAAIGLCFSEYEWQLYFFPILDLMHGAPGTAARSIISKNIDSNELGQVFSVIGALDVLTPLAVYPAYNMLYKYTFEIMPGAFYFLSVFLAFITLILFSMVYLMEKQTKNLDKEKVKEKLGTDNSADVPLMGVPA